MRLLFIADGRSPIAQGWIQYFIEAGDEVHLATTFPGESGLQTASTTFVPVAFSRAKTSPTAQGRRTAEAQRGQGGVWGSAAVGLRTSLRHWLGTLTIPAAGRQVADLVRTLQPDLVHALRIPFEGMAAARAFRSLGRAGFKRPPLITSVWGNDFTLHAAANWMMKQHTRQALAVAAALHTDCQRDARLARAWGFAPERPILVTPTSGGIHRDVFHLPADDAQRAPGMVIQPRGVRAYVRNDTFFAAVPLILAARPQTRFICPAMQADGKIQALIERLGVAHAVTLLPRTPRNAMADLFRQAQVVVSVTNHDGTPNTLLEAMACGSFPVVGDIETMYEWITPGENGLVVPPGDPQALAQAVIRALDDSGLRARAARRNQEIIAERAEYAASMIQARTLYANLVGGK